MWAMALFVWTFVFMVIDYFLFNRDYFHPSFIFSMMFFLSSVFCLICAKDYSIHLHVGTFLVLFFTQFLFTATSAIIENSNKSSHRSQEVLCKVKKIEVPRIAVFALLFIQFVTIFFFIKHLRAFSISYDGVGRSLSESIDLYDKISKFHPLVFARKEPPAPILYRIGDPISRAGGFVCLYILINNFIITKKIDILYVIPVVGLCAVIFLRGSRSPLLRILTMALILYYILGYRFSHIRKGDIRVISKFLIIVLVSAIGFMLMLPLMGRRGAEESGGLLNYSFIYIGGPLLNLDSIVSKGKVWLFGSINPSLVWGNYTFGGFYSILGGKLNFEHFDPMFTTIGGWAKSENGLNTGNVYTHFYTMLYDFGYVGTIIVNCIFIGYYCISYHKVIHDHSDNVFDFRLFLYTYLFNDLVMSIFAARFFETLSSKSFLKVMFVSYVFSIFLNKRIEWVNNRVIIHLRSDYSVRTKLRHIFNK